MNFFNISSFHSLNFSKTIGDVSTTCVYVKSLDDSSFIFLLLYVDDMLVAGNHLGLAKKILGMKIHMDRKSKQLWLSQHGYVEKVLDKFNTSNVKPVSTPFAKHFKLSINQCSKIDVEVKYMSKVLYASAVGCLMYAMVYTKSNLTHVVSQVCKFMSVLRK